MIQAVLASKKSASEFAGRLDPGGATKLVSGGLTSRQKMPPSMVRTRCSVAAASRAMAQPVAESVMWMLVIVNGWPAAIWGIGMRVAVGVPVFSGPGTVGWGVRVP